MTINIQNPYSKYNNALPSTYIWRNLKKVFSSNLEMFIGYNCTSLHPLLCKERKNRYMDRDETRCVKQIVQKKQKIGSEKHLKLQPVPPQM